MIVKHLPVEQADHHAAVTHPLGSKARVLLTSVFGPYAQDDEYGSRKMNPMELYHNQVTREQGPFSLLMFHRSWGLMWIQAIFKTTTRYYRKKPAMHAKMEAILHDLHHEFGFRSRLFSSFGGWWLLGRIRREAKRLAAGSTCEPPAFYEKQAHFVEAERPTGIERKSPRQTEGKMAGIRESVTPATIG